MKLSTVPRGRLKSRTLVSIVIPSYNPGFRILKLLRGLKALEIPNSVKEIIVVNDGSIDLVYDQVKKDKEIFYFEHKKNVGKGGAVKTGFEKSKGDILMIQDDDLEYDVLDIPKLLAPILGGKTEVVFGSRSINKKSGYSSKMYLWGGLLVNNIIKLFLKKNITDSITGSKAFTRNVYEKIKPIESKGFDIESELTVKIVKNGFDILEVPISYYPRTREEGKNIRWYHAFRIIIGIWRYSR